MKRNNLFKTVGIAILVLVLLSWIVPIVYSVAGIKLVGEETVSTQIGFVSIIDVVLETFSGFGGVVLYVLLVGAFYGVFKATGAFDKVTEFLSDKVSGKEKGTLIVTMIAMALISSVSGLDLGLLFVFPLLIALFVKIGYDKMVALSATLGATIVGMYGATFAGTLYGTNNTLLGLKNYSQIVPKVILFILGIAALLFAVVRYCANKKMLFDGKSARKTVLIEGIVLSGMTLIASSVLLVSQVLGGVAVSTVWIVLASVALVLLSLLVFMLSNKNVWTTLLVLFGLVLAFSATLAIGLGINSIVSVLWIVIASVSLVLLGLSIFMLVKKCKELSSSKNKRGNSKKYNKYQKVNAKKDAVVKAKENRNKKEVKGAIPGLVIFAIVLLIVFLGTTSWGSIFKSNWFATAHTSWTGFTISGFAILNKLFGGLDALGTWTVNTSRFQTYSVILIVAMVVLKFVYKTKWEDVFNGFLDGLKKYVVPAILTVLACSVFVLVFYNQFLPVVTKNLLTASKEFNVVLVGIYTIINSVFYVDYYYLSNSLLYGITSIYDDTAVLSIISVMFTNLYSLVMLVAPTSVLLLVSLSISDVKYTDWIKYIWKLVVALFVISFIVFTVMVLV